MEKIDDNICLTQYIDGYGCRIFPTVADFLQC